jgi:hypothetical protein
MEQTSQDLFKEAQEQSDTILGQLQTDLSTVMGPAEAGTIDQQLLQDRLKELGNPPARSANPETKKAYMDKLAVLMQETVREQAEQLANTAVNKTAATITQSVEKSVQKVKEAVQASKKQWEETLTQANNTTAGGVNSQQQSVQQEKRRIAAERFKEQTHQVENLLKQTEQQDVRVKALDLRIKLIYESDTLTEAQQDDITQTTQRRRNCIDQKKYLQEQIIEIYENSLRHKKKGDLIALDIPKDLQAGKGQMLIESMKAYLRGRADEYYAIMPYLYRTMDDYDPDTGTFWEPPARRSGGYNQIPAATRSIYAEQAANLYSLIWKNLQTEIQNRIRSTYKYGLHEQKENRCEVSDGPAALFALISLYKPIKAAHRDQLTEDFNQAWTHFTKGDPVRKIKHLRPKLVEAIQLGMHLNWSTTGKKIVQVLSQNDHVMAQELKQFEKGPENTEDTNKHLQDLFAAIEAEAAKVKLVFPGDKKEWHASFAGADERRPCRYGTDCTDTLCTRSHPQGFKRNRTEFEHSKGKGKGGKGGKGTSGKGGKGKGLGGKGKGGKGGRGRPACEAQGCSQLTPHPSKALCTTCFKKVIDTGSVTKKDGTTFTFRGKQDSQDKQPENNTYGFSAEQLEGLKVMQQASAYRADGLIDDGDELEPPAPASVKRARIAERLGRRADTARSDDRTANFLEAINRK